MNKKINPVVVELPGKSPWVLHHLVLDFTGTLSKDGKLLSGVAGRLKKISRRIPITVLTADTFGKAAESLKGLPVAMRIIRNGKDKADIVRKLGAGQVVAIGNGRNDIPMMRIARIGIAVIGPEGAAGEFLRTADVAVRDIREGLDLVLNPLRMKATLRG